MARSTRKKTSPNAAPSRRRAPARADPPTIEATPLDHLAPDQGSNAPKLPAKPRQKERAPPEKARSLLGALPKKSPPGKRQRRGGDESQLLSPEEQALGPYSMDSVDAKVDAYNAWKDVGRELVRGTRTDARLRRVVRACAGAYHHGGGQREEVGQRATKEGVVLDHSGG